MTSNQNKRPRIGMPSPSFLENQPSNSIEAEYTSEQALTISTPKTSRTKISYTSGDISRQLTRHRIFLDAKAYRKYPGFWEDVRSIVVSKRNSPTRASHEWKEKKQQRFEVKINNCQGYERTFLLHVLPLVIRKIFTPHQASEAKIQERITAEEGLDLDPQFEFNIGKMNEWTRHGLFTAEDVPFKRQLVPIRHQDVILQVPEYKGTSWGLTNPIPDRTYGFQQGYLDFTIPPELYLSPELAMLISVWPVCDHSFFFTEGKSASGNIEDMYNQARRDGATLLHVHRLLLRMAGLLPQPQPTYPAKPGQSYPYAESETIVFSMEVSGQTFQLFCHWAEVFAENSVSWHMDLVEEVSCRRADARETISSCCHNILEWGLFQRKDEIIRMRHQLFNAELVKQKKTIISEEEAGRRGFLGPVVGPTNYQA
ncbi:MAG: hypothetical protein Q9163_005955 [Psora crenata]